ncbi:uncharacterized protein [Penaeus vannamei]|uniref:uncharacterized protein n=1 Tax=Penaeus vannamei TaxID=6689 RepID=UPI00387F6364
MSVGLHGSGINTGSENSLFFLDFARSQKLRISGFWYQCPDPHRWTWYRDAGNAAKKIDHILVSTRRILQNYKVFRSAEFCGTDHRLVVATFQVHFKTPQQTNDQHRVFHLDRLKERECARGFAETISDCFTALDNLTDPVLLWDTFKRKTFNAAQESIGECPRARQNLISQETLEATDACCAARLAGDQDLHRSQVRRTRSLRKLNSMPSEVRLEGDQIVSDPVAVREHWAEYFEQLHLVDPPSVNLDAGSAVMPLPDPPSLTEVRRAISKLKSGKAAGKVLAHILLRRIRDHLLRHQRPEQSAFTPGKSTMDSILALRVIVERRSKPLGQEVSWTKTKIQDFGDLLGELVRSVRACGEDIEIPENFTYLDSVVHNSGLSDQETGTRPVTCTIRVCQLRLCGTTRLCAPISVGS